MLPDSGVRWWEGLMGREEGVRGEGRVGNGRSGGWEKGKGVWRGEVCNGLSSGMLVQLSKAPIELSCP